MSQPLETAPDEEISDFNDNNIALRQDTYNKLSDNGFESIVCA